MKPYCVTNGLLQSGYKYLLFSPCTLTVPDALPLMPRGTSAVSEPVTDMTAKLHVNDKISGFGQVFLFIYCHSLIFRS